LIDRIKRGALYEFLKPHRYGVISTVSKEGMPEAAYIGLAATPELDLIFETLNTSRKFLNLRRNPHAALVIGWDHERTLQYEGVAEEPDEFSLDDLKDTYYAALPENRGHDGWPGLTYVRIRPRWIRVSNYGSPWNVEEFRFDS
jgi:pyridoxine/pyridoxamine 5'-phosphate oxidase